MKMWLRLSFVLLCGCSGEKANPIIKVLQMIENLEQDNINDGNKQQKAYAEFAGMCRARSKELQLEIKTASSLIEDLQATIGKATDDESEAVTAIEELSGAISQNEADLTAAVKIRKTQAADFAEEQKDLLDTVGQMQRAMSILGEEMRGDASFAQMPESFLLQKRRALVLIDALTAVVGASFIHDADASALQSFIQNAEVYADSDADGDAVFNAKTTGLDSIMEMLESLLEKAQTQLADAREKEMKAAHNFELFKGSLQRKIAVGEKDMNELKKEKAGAGQARAQAEGDLEVARKGLAEDTKGLEQLHHECMTRASDFEDDTKSRAQELKALGTAKKIIKESTGESEKESKLVQVSFLQRGIADPSEIPQSTAGVVEMVLQLGKQQRLPQLIQMSRKMRSVVRNCMMTGEDPFKKVKSLLRSMLTNLEKQMQEEAAHKAYCDAEMSGTKKNQAEKESMVDKLKTKVDTQLSQDVELKEEVASIHKELYEISKTQQEMDRMRQSERVTYEKSKPKLEAGLSGIKKALGVLREYYSQDEKKSSEASGGGGGIIAMLETIASDLDMGLSRLELEEETAQKEYKEQTLENSEAKALKEQGISQKTKQLKALGKSTSESSTDLDAVQTELDAINEYYAKIQQECVAKPDTYEETRKRQEAMLKGLRDAMVILGGKAALMQQPARYMRGARFRGATNQDSADDNSPA